MQTRSSTSCVSRDITRRDWLRVVGAASASAWLAGRSIGSPAKPAGDLRLMVVGQSLIKSDLRAHPYDGFDSVVALLSAADVRFTNLEVSIDAPGAGQPTKSGIYFHVAKPVVLDCLKAISFNLLSLCNNHAFDLGTEGILTTRREVAQRGFHHAGSGATIAEAARPAFMETSKGTVALIAMASKINPASIATTQRAGLNHLAVSSDGQVNDGDRRRILQSIREAAARARVVLVYQHNHYWAPDNRNTPAWQRQWARECIDAGASLFVNHGVPLLHGIEIYRNAPIFYCLGNFVFHTHTKPGHYTDEVWQSVAADLRFSPRGWESMMLHPLRLTGGEEGELFFATRGRPQPAKREEGRNILRRLEKLSQPYDTKFHFDDQGKATIARIG